MTEPVYCKDCEYIHENNIAYGYPIFRCVKKDLEIPAYTKPCEDFKPREGEGE